MSDELKPCPFCGSSDVYLGQDSGTQWWYAHCNDCQMEGIYDLGWSGATERWNTRPLEDALRAELAAAKAEIERLRAVIRKAEWVTEDGDSQPFCTGCGASFIKGHDGDCPFCQWEAK